MMAKKTQAAPPAYVDVDSTQMINDYLAQVRREGRWAYIDEEAQLVFRRVLVEVTASNAHWFPEAAALVPLKEARSAPMLHADAVQRMNPDDLALMSREERVAYIDESARRVYRPVLVEVTASNAHLFPEAVVWVPLKRVAP